MTTRKLTLRRDPLSVLADADLTVVAAGASGGPSCAGTCELRCLDAAPGPSFLITCPATACTPCPL